jgi:DNA-binding response OmpR family regulator
LRTIVVVEDEQASREGLLVLLARAGYRTIGAGTLKEARHILEEITPDLLIVDIRLSGDNGLQLLAMARNPIPAIVITAFDDRTLAAEARNFGAEFMLKPVSPAALLAAIQRKVPATSDQPAGPSRLLSAIRPPASWMWVMEACDSRCSSPELISRCLSGSGSLFLEMPQSICTSCGIAAAVIHGSAEPQ